MTELVSIVLMALAWCLETVQCGPIGQLSREKREKNGKNRENEHYRGPIQSVDMVILSTIRGHGLTQRDTVLLTGGNHIFCGDFIALC